MHPYRKSEKYFLSKANSECIVLLSQKDLNHGILITNNSIQVNAIKQRSWIIFSVLLPSCWCIKSDHFISFCFSFLCVKYRNGLYYFTGFSNAINIYQLIYCNSYAMWVLDPSSHLIVRYDWLKWKFLCIKIWESSLSILKCLWGW